MSDLRQLQLKIAVRKQLERKQWTIEKLATAEPAELIRFKGVGLATSREIVKRAQEIINQIGLEQSQQLDPMPEPEPLVMKEAEGMMHLSVRQRRILAARKEEE